MTDFFGTDNSDEIEDWGASRPAVRKPAEKLPSVAAAAQAPGLQPLADRLRPHDFADFLGQEKLVGDGAPLRQLIAGDRVPSMILWGPPGSGKTTLASLVARSTNSDFISLSAVSAGLKDVRDTIAAAKVNRQYARRTILFIDEIHRFNKTQQDAFLPHVESGLVTLIGATTENPSFSVNSALLSRCRVYTLASLGPEHVRRMLARGVEELNKGRATGILSVDEDAMEAIASLSDGDGRRALGVLEVAADVARHRSGGAASATVDKALVQDVSQRALMYDRSGEEHYNLVSALHKTIRSSDPHGALYWCERMMAAGEDRRFLLRRLVRMAAEDIGLAAPQATNHAVACMDAFDRLGAPEGDLFVSQLAVYLATCPKSNAVYVASKQARAVIGETGTLPVPLHLRNAPTGLMKNLGYSSGYTYDHDSPDRFVPKQGLPDDLDGRMFYEPSDQGAEAEIARKLRAWDEQRDEERRTRKA